MLSVKRGNLSLMNTNKIAYRVSDDFTLTRAPELDKTQWEDLANEAIADGLYWKNETRNAQLKAQRLAEALRDIRDCAYDPSQVAEVTFDSGKLAARIYAVANAALVLHGKE